MPKEQQQQQIAGMDATPEQQAKMVHLGQMMGDPRDDFDREVEKHLSDLDREHEASYAKMHAASQGLAPTEMEDDLAKQQQALQRQAAIQAQAQASQAQAAQAPNQPPPAPAGPAGVSQPYPAQARSQGQPAPPEIAPDQVQDKQSGASNQ